MAHVMSMRRKARRNLSLMVDLFQHRQGCLTPPLMAVAVILVVNVSLLKKCKIKLENKNYSSYVSRLILKLFDYCKLEATRTEIQRYDTINSYVHRKSVSQNIFSDKNDKNQNAFSFFSCRSSRPNVSVCIFAQTFTISEFASRPPFPIAFLLLHV